MIGRDIVLGLSYAAIVVWAFYLVKCKGKRLYALAPLLWLMNVAAFFTFRVFFYQPGIDVQLLNGWSLGVYAHGLITLLGAGVMVVREEVGRC
jgi:energy-coupling factor transporter transmembrane protein EcfT